MEDDLWGGGMIFNGRKIFNGKQYSIEYNLQLLTIFKRKMNFSVGKTLVEQQQQQPLLDPIITLVNKIEKVDWCMGYFN